SRAMNPPQYPPSAVRSGIEGTVILVISIDAKGNVLDIEVEKSSRNRDLDRAAIDAARKWRFSPEIRNGAPVASRVRVPVDFTLDCLRNNCPDFILFRQYRFPEPPLAVLCSSLLPRHPKVSVMLQETTAAAAAGGNNADAFQQMSFSHMVQNFDLMAWIVFTTLTLFSVLSI